VASLIIYLDSSIVVPLFLPDEFNARAEAFLLAGPTGLVISDFVRAEFASVVGIRARTKEMSVTAARAALSNLDLWEGRKTARAETNAADIRAAEEMLRRLNMTLRAPDAINLAIARRLGAELATFDERMANCAKVLGVALTKL